MIRSQAFRPGPFLSGRPGRYLLSWAGVLAGPNAGPFLGAPPRHTPRGTNVTLAINGAPGVAPSGARRRSRRLPDPETESRTFCARGVRT